MQRNDARLAAAAAVLLFVACAEPSSSPYAPRNHRASLSTDWPNEPPTLTVISDYAFDDPLPSPSGSLSGGWGINNPNGYATQLTNDAEAPLSPPNVGQWSYPVGFQGGSPPAAMYLDPPSHSKEAYVGFWWKASNPWQDNNAATNEFITITTASPNSDAVIDLHEVDAAPTYAIDVITQFAGMSVAGLQPNVNNTNVTLGQWHRIEWYLKYSTTSTSGDGVIKWWLDGVLQGDYENQNMPDDAGFEQFQFRPAWDGTDTKSEQDYFWFDHLHVSENTGAAPAWPNEPVGYTVLSDEPWNALAENGWSVANNGAGNVTIAQDATAPLSPSNVAQFEYPTGFVDGTGPGEAIYDFAATNRVFVGLWWKPSDPWQGDSSNVNKIEYIQSTSGNGSIMLVMYGSPGGPYQLRVFPQFTGKSLDRWLTPNVNADNVTLGVWHRIEWLVDYSGTTGHIQWWLDGRLQGDWSDDPVPAGPLIEYQLNPVWGGNWPDTKRETDYYWFDHTHLSVN
ncbi:MAG TPA: hypothetical protein VFD85_06735 [Gemmatimonadales bacterium]|nr:hypothetical protein [Gemmatimonadales bacterium]